MNWIDKAIAIFSPQKAFEREAWRQELERMSGYDANTQRFGRNWAAYNDSAENIDRYSRDSIRAKARDLERNSDIAQSLVRAYRRNVIGRGFTLQARTDYPELNAQLEELWRLWCKPYNCDVTGTQSFNQMLRMAITRKRYDGGILIVKRYTRKGVLPLQLQMLEVDELDTTAVTPKYKGNTVVGGIEYDSYRRAVGYYIRQYSVDGWQLEKPIYIPAKDVIFYFSKSRPSQLREISDLAPTLPRIRDINEYMTAVSVKERIAACLAVLIKRATPAGYGGRNGQEVVRQSYNEKSLVPGMFKELNPGDDVSVVNPGSSATDATGFLKTLYSLIGAGQGLSYEVTSRDMSRTNYSSARQGLIEDETTYYEEVELLKELVLDEIYETFVISAILAGAVVIPDFWERKAEYMKHEFVAAPRKWIDPQKEASAAATALSTGQKTFKQVAAENGMDWKDQIDDIAEVVEYGESLGLDMATLMFSKPIYIMNDNTTEGDNDEQE